VRADNVLPVSWAERAADRSPLVQRSRSRSLRQARVIVGAAERLIAEQGGRFTTQELAQEAGVAMQTFYRHFAGKDQLILAVIEDLVAGRTAELAEAGRAEPDPVARLRQHVTEVLSTLDTGARSASARFITAEHWRLHQLYPAELEQAIRPYTDLLADDLREARDAGLLRPTDVERDAELMMRLVMSVFHHHAFAASAERADVVLAHLWNFCLAGVGGAPVPWRPTEA
jgi:AcrR family transcriptional regulator